LGPPCKITGEVN